MKKWFPFLKGGIVLIIAFIVVNGDCIAGTIPFKVGTGGILDGSIEKGVGVLYEQQALGTDTFYLNEGETSHVIDFFIVTIPLALGTGSVEAVIELLSPTPLSEASNRGSFGVFSFLSFSCGAAQWDAPQTIEYSYNGLHGGILSLDLFDIPKTFQLGTTFTISGTLTNERNPFSSPLPSTLFMFGTGLIGLVVFRRNRPTQEQR